VSTAADVIQAFALEPHPEGGFYRETFRSRRLVVTERGPRPAATAIFFLVTADHRSRFHRLVGDELWLFHGGAPLEIVTLLPDGRVEREVLRRAEDTLASETLTPQLIVPAGAWQAARLPPGADPDWALVSCVVTPGFDYEDFELAEKDMLLAAYPEAEELISALV
jgi:uncharacterized protein